MAWTTYLLVMLVMAAASTVQSSVGMGQGLIAAPLFRLLHEPLLPGPIVVAGLLTSLVLAARNSQRSDIAPTIPAILGRVVGIGIALAMLAVLSERGLTLAIAGFVLLFVACRVVGLKLERTPRTLAGAGVASGIGGTIAALGGAPLGLLYSQHVQARDFRGPMGIISSVGGSITVVGLVITGKLDTDGWLLALSLVPPLALGWLLARWLTPIVDRGFLASIVLGLSATSAALLLVKGLLL